MSTRTPVARTVNSEASLPRDRSATQARLIQAATDVFGEVGFHSATLTEIASRAQANVALISRYFDGKTGLLYAVIDHIIETKQVADLPYPARESLKEELRDYLRFRYAEDRRNRGIYRLIISEAVINEDFKARALNSLQYGRDTNILERLGSLARKGKLKRDCDTESLFRMVSLFSFSVGFVEGELLDLEADRSDRIIVDFAFLLGRQYGV